MCMETNNGKFEDEFNKLLKHDERGVIAMANSGPNTNGSQFYILYQPAPHLDGKHLYLVDLLEEWMY